LALGKAPSNAWRIVWCSYKVRAASLGSISAMLSNSARA
jgi:hypothetical protein